MLTLLILGFLRLAPCTVSPADLESIVAEMFCGDENTEECVPLADDALAVQRAHCGTR